jgi:hypothetical protein
MTHIDVAQPAASYAQQDYAVFCNGVAAARSNRQRKPPSRLKGEPRRLWLAGYDAERYERRLLAQHGLPVDN